MPQGFARSLAERARSASVAAVKKTVFITDHPWPDLHYERGRLEAEGFRVVAGTSAALPRADIDAIAERERPQAIMTCWAQVSATAIGHCRDLAIVARYGVGLDNIALDAAWAAGARVTNVPDYCVEEVSDHAVAMLLAWSRGIVQWDREVKRGVWDPALARLRRTRGLVVGLVGYGRAGKLVARKLSGWGLRVLACGRTAPTGDDARLVEWMTLDALLPRCDAVIALLPLSPATASLFDAARLAQMKRGALFVNVSRGGLADNAAILAALDSGQLDAAALDVIAGEPDPPVAVTAHPRVIATPHIAFSSPDAIQELRERTVDEVLRAFRGEPARVLVAPGSL